MRVKGGTVSRARRKKIVKLAKGYRVNVVLISRLLSNKYGSHICMHTVIVRIQNVTSVSYGLLVSMQQPV